MPRFVSTARPPLKARARQLQIEPSHRRSLNCENPGLRLVPRAFADRGDAARHRAETRRQRIVLWPSNFVELRPIARGASAEFAIHFASSSVPGSDCLNEAFQLEPHRAMLIKGRSHAVRSGDLDCEFAGACQRDTLHGTLVVTGPLEMFLRVLREMRAAGSLHRFRSPSPIGCSAPIRRAPNARLAFQPLTLQPAPLTRQHRRCAAFNPDHPSPAAWPALGLPHAQSISVGPSPRPPNGSRRIRMPGVSWR